jgi:NAD-dependent SIR2 family protein deacetylase
MHTDDIQKFLQTKAQGNKIYIKIDFRSRESIYGLFLTDDQDFKELSSKNFWRIVTRKYFDEYNRSKNPNLARIFNGAEFTKLSLLADDF